MNSFCTEPGVLNAFLIIKTCLELFKIIVPIVLIIICMLDLAKSVASNDDTLQKVFPKIVKRIMAACMVFLIPSIIGLILGVVDNNADYRSSSCWTNANKETIANLEIAKAAEIRAQIEEMSMQDYVSLKNIYSVKLREPNTSLPEKMVAIALEQVGNKGKTYQNAWGAGIYSKWCVMFVWWTSREAGVYPNLMTLKTGTTGDMYNYFKSGKDSNVSWHPSLSRKGAIYTPKPADYIMFNFGDSRYVTTHIGIVVKTEGDTITFVHGNTSDSPSTNTVKTGTIKLNSKNVVGYGSWY